MTIINDYCPDCEQTCQDHPRMCTTCGSGLQARPSNAPSVNSLNSTTARSRNPGFASNFLGGVRLVPEDHISDLAQGQIANDLAQSNQELAVVLSRLRQRVSDIRQQVSEIREQQAALPAEAMDPQAGPSGAKPTAKATLAEIPRITITAQTSLLHQATLTVGSTASTFEAVVGEFGPTPPLVFENRKLVIASPRTGKGGLTFPPNMKDAIVYMERGGGITFAQKALMAQKLGACAVVIGNHVAEPWPYVMKDSQGEARSGEGLQIPVVMVKQADGIALVKKATTDTSDQASSSLHILTPTAHDCIICVDPMSIGSTVMRLPGCGHTFHEKCACLWLQHHNSCPTCRRELPTDNMEEEEDRRRRQGRTDGDLEVEFYA